MKNAGLVLLIWLSAGLQQVWSQECDIEWEDLTNTTVTGTELKKTSGGNGWNADANSAQTIPANTDGYVIYEASYPNNSLMIGLTDQNTSTSGGDMEFRFYFTYHPTHLDRRARIYVHGTMVSSGTIYEIGDQYRIRREGTQIHFERKPNGSGSWGTPLYTTDAYIPSGSSTLPEMIVDCSIYYQNAAIRNAKISCAAPAYAVPQKSLNGSYYKCVSGQLKLRLEERYYNSSSQLALTIYDASGSIVYQPTNLTSNTGVELHDIDLRATGFFNDQDFYVVELKNSKGIKNFLRIQYYD